MPPGVMAFVRILMADLVRDPREGEEDPVERAADRDHAGVVPCQDPPGFAAVPQIRQFDLQVQMIIPKG